MMFRQITDRFNFGAMVFLLFSFYVLNCGSADKSNDQSGDMGQSEEDFNTSFSQIGAQEELNAENLYLNERMGYLKIDQPQDTILSILSEPDTKGPEEEWDAVGTFVSKWKYSGNGISLHMVAKQPGGKKKVLMFTVAYPCTLKTSKGIGIGSTEAQVRSAYREFEAKDSSQPGRSFVAGSLYGGIIFSFQGGNVSKIFVGSTAR